MKKTLFRLLLTLSFSFAPILAYKDANATAKSGVHLTKPSANWDVGMLFYKMTGAKPDFHSWVTSDPRYAQIAPDKQAAYIEQEVLNLNAAYSQLDLKKGVVIVRTAVKLQMKAGTTPEKEILAVQFPGQGNLYFPYPVAGQTIAVIPNGIDLYRNIPVSMNESRIIKPRLGPLGDATMVVEIVPVKADGTQPMTLDNMQQWLMLGEIGYIGFYNSYLELLWSFQAPWYTLQGQNDLLNLHKAAGDETGSKIPAKE